MAPCFPQIKTLLLIFTVVWTLHLFPLASGTKIGQSCDDDSGCDNDNLEDCGLINSLTKLTCECTIHEVRIRDQLVELELEPNDAGICLGPVGFPCKSNPFKNSTHGSCVTGFCDEPLDKCTSKESAQTKKRSIGASHSMMGYYSFALSIIGGLLLLRIIMN